MCLCEQYAGGRHPLILPSSALQVCTGARAEEDKATGVILKCLVGNVDKVSPSCARETGRAARNALTFYQPKAQVTDVCDSDVASLCLGSQGLQSMGIGEVRVLPSMCDWLTRLGCMFLQVVP